MLKEFKAFALKGNVLDMAVGVVIGGAFSKIIASFVSDIIMPLLSLITGGSNFSDLSVTLAGGDVPVMLNYGSFIQNIIDFMIIAAALFIFVKIINKFKRTQEKPPEEPALSKEAELLSEIKELLEKNAGQSEPQS